MLIVASYLTDVRVVSIVVMIYVVFCRWFLFFVSGGSQSTNSSSLISGPRSCLTKGSSSVAIPHSLSQQQHAALQARSLSVCLVFVFFALLNKLTSPQSWVILTLGKRNKSIFQNVELLLEPVWVKLHFEGEKRKQHCVYFNIMG